jgi:DnaJ family protein B protein 4
VPEEKYAEISVKPGWKAGTKVTFEGWGDEEPGCEPGDIIFTIQEKKHPRFTRNGPDLIHRRAISLTDALCGTNFEIVGIDGETIKIDTTKDVLSPSSTKRVRGKGMPKRQGGHGDLIIEFDISFPTQLSDQQKKKLRELKLS